MINISLWLVKKQRGESSRALAEQGLTLRHTGVKLALPSRRAIAHRQLGERYVGEQSHLDR